MGARLTATRPDALLAALPRALPAALPRALLASRSRALCLALAGALCCVPGCGPDGPPVDAPLAVVARGLPWRLDADAAAFAPYDLAWDRASDLPPWEAAAGTTVTPGRDGWALSGTARLRVVSPASVTLEPALQQVLNVAARAPEGVVLVLGWRGPGQAFDPDRIHPSGTGTRDEQGESTWTVPLADLVGRSMQASGAEAGLEQLSLEFLRPGDDAPLEVELRSVIMPCRFSAGTGANAATSASDRASLRLERHGVQLRGTALMGGGSARAPLHAGPRDRLRLWLAATGPLRATLADADGLLQPTVIDCAADDAWRGVSLDLAPLDGAPAELVLSTEVLGDGPPPALLVGAVLRLAPGGTNEHSGGGSSRSDSSSPHTLATAPAIDARPAGLDPATAPHVILYLEDTLRADHLSTYGYAEPTDPALAQLAQQGVAFERVQAASNWTRPAVTSIHSALSPLRHGVVSRDLRLVPDAVTLAEAFAQAGWLTASFVTNVHGGEAAGLHQGFDLGTSPVAHGAGALTSTLTSEAVAGPLDALLAEHRDERLFVLVHSLDPHAPYAPPGGDLYPLQVRGPERPPLRAAPAAEAGRGPDVRVGPQRPRLEQDALRYDAEILHNDRRLGRLDQTLARLELTGRTLLAFVSDHGESFDEHGYLSHKSTLYQEELAVPWVLRWPDALPAGLRVPGLATHVDVAPTLAGLAGVPVPDSWEGRDLSGVLTAGAAWRDVPVLSHFVSSSGEREQLAVVRWPLKLVAQVGGAAGGGGDTRALQPLALYDLAADPFEHHDLRDDPARAAALADLLSYGERALAAGAVAAERTGALDPATRAWLQALGYLGK